MKSDEASGILVYEYKDQEYVKRMRRVDTPPGIDPIS